MNIKFGTDGIRGPVESVITPEVCLRIGHASGIVLKEMGWEPKINLDEGIKESVYNYRKDFI